MGIIFYPHLDELESSNVEEKLEVLLESAERYKAAILDAVGKASEQSSDQSVRISTPRNIEHAYNWEEIAKVLGEIRNMQEGSSTLKLSKADKLAKLAEIYEVLRGAKMPKLEAVRLALMNEVAQLRGSSNRVA